MMQCVKQRVHFNLNILANLALVMRNNNNKAPGQMARHHALNDIVCRAFITAGIPAFKEPAGLCTRDGKRPDSLSFSLIP